MFVCEYIESSNGLIYFKGIKAFQCDFNVGNLESSPRI